MRSRAASPLQVQPHSGVGLPCRAVMSLPWCGRKKGGPAVGDPPSQVVTAQLRATRHTDSTSPLEGIMQCAVPVATLPVTVDAILPGSTNSWWAALRPGSLRQLQCPWGWCGQGGLRSHHFGEELRRPSGKRQMVSWVGSGAEEGTRKTRGDLSRRWALAAEDTSRICRDWGSWTRGLRAGLGVHSWLSVPAHSSDTHAVPDPESLERTRVADS